MSPEPHRVLVEEYGIADPVVFDRGVGQGQSRRLEIGSGGLRYMAKHLGAGLSTADLAYECSLLSHLKKGDIPVAGNLTTLSGDPFAMIDGRPFVVYEWAEGGVEWPASSAKAKLLGRSVAQMHLVADFAEESPKVYSIERLIDRPLSLLEPFALDRAEFEGLAKLTESYREQLAAIPTEPPFFGPIHGDIHQGNCHFGEAGGLTIVDFALCGVGYRAYDLTGFLWPMRDRTIEDEAMRTCCMAFLDGYESVRALHPAERNAIPAFVQLRSLWESGDWVDTGTGREQPAEVAKAIPYLLSQFEDIAS